MIFRSRTLRGTYFLLSYLFIVVSFCTTTHTQKINECLKDPQLKSRFQNDLNNVRALMNLTTGRLFDIVDTHLKRPTARIRAQLLMEDTKSLYVRIYKCGNNQISYNLERDHGAVRKRLENISNLKDMCVFTFVRDPVSRFSSGYNEIEYRMTLNKDFFNKYFQTKKKQNKEIFFHSLPAGSQARVHVFFHEYVEGKLVDMPEIEHLDPMVLFLMNRRAQLPPLKFVGHVDNLDAGFQEAQTVCGFSNVTSLDHDLGQHPTSADPLGTYHASKEFFSQSSSVQALCALYATDYQCFGLPLPANCIQA